MKPAYDYEKDAAAIYRRSFAVIRGEADLKRFSPIEERVAVRVIHACGMVEAADDLVFSPGAAEAAREALRAGAPIFCDARMVAEGVTRARLPAHNDVVCTLADPSTPELAARLGTTRTAAAIELWLPRLGGSLVAISPQTPEQSAETARHSQLSFHLLIDRQNLFARELGLVYRLPAAMQTELRKTGLLLPTINGDDSWELPIPATYLVRQDGVIVDALLDADFYHRKDPQELVKELRELPH